MAIALAAASAFVNAWTSVLQRIGVESAPAESTMRFSLIAYAVRRRVWLAGFGLMLVSGGLLAVALRFGELSVVQPVATTEIVFLVAILGLVFRYPVGAREWTGAGLLVAGLGAFFVAADPKGGQRLPPTTDWLVSSAVIVVVVVGAIVAARYGPRWWRAASFGVAAAADLAYNAALIKAATTYSTHGWVQVFTHVQIYAIAVTGLFGVFLIQNALHAGPITASRATMITGNPLISIVLGVVLFGDRLRTGVLFVSLECLALAVMVAGIVVLTQSPLVAGTGDPSAPGELLAEARRGRRAADVVAAGLVPGVAAGLVPGAVAEGEGGCGAEVKGGAEAEGSGEVNGGAEGNGEVKGGGDAPSPPGIPTTPVS